MYDKTKLMVVFVALAAWSGLYANYYVAQNGQKPEHPFTSWTSAASNIQDAVNAATNLSTIWVDNGTYRFPTNAVGSNVLHITKALTLRGVNGAESTIVNGDGLYRCLYTSLSAAACAAGPLIVDGFTFTNGYVSEVARGAGIYLNSTSIGTGTSIVQNCVVSGNILQQNTDMSRVGGGGIYSYAANHTAILSNCLVAGNSTIKSSQGDPSGGGLWFRTNGLIVDCIFQHNESSGSGGAVYFSSPGSVVDRCTIISNSAPPRGGGVYMYDGDSELRNSFIAYNTGQYGGGVYGYNVLCMYNCTVASNSGSSAVHARNSVIAGIVNNCIVDDSIEIGSGATVTGYNNCLPFIPASGDWHNTLVTTNNPATIRFVDAASGNYRLASGSPCINAGINEPDWLADAMDVDGNARIDRYSGQVDIGCYEYQPRGTFIILR